MFEVVVFKDGVEIGRHALRPGSLNLGRADDSHIVLKADSVSRRHARFLVEANKVIVEDLGSGNGTFMGGEKISRRQELHHGDEVSIAPFLLRLNAPHLAGDAHGNDPGADARTIMMPAGGPAAAARPAAFTPGGPTGAQLFVIRGNAGRSSYELKAGPFTVGRADDRDMVLADPSSSRRHATLHFEGDHYRVDDEGSANGIIVNGKVCRTAELKSGDRVVIGETEIEFQWPTGPARSQANPLAGGHDQFGETNFVPAYSPWEATDQVSSGTQQQVQSSYDAGAYGAMEMAPQTTRRSPLKLILGVVLVLMIAGIGIKVASDSGAEQAAVPVAAQTDPCAAYDLTKGCPDAVDEGCRRCLILKTRMENGKELFRQKEFPRALQEFQQILQSIDAGHPEARRMAYLTYEFWVLTTVDETLQDRAQTTAQKMGSLTEEMDKARKIYEEWGNRRYTRETPEATLRSARASLSTAMTSLNAAVKIKVDDEAGKALLTEAEDLKTKVNYKLTEIRRVLEAGTQEAMENELQALFNEAMSAKNSGNKKLAIKKLGELIAKDAGGESDLSRKAKTEIAAINASVRAEATPHYNQGVTNLNNGLLLEARNNFNKALNIDPGYAEAKAKLKEVDSACQTKGAALYQEAKVQYNVNQFSQAEKLLRQVLEFIPDPKDPYHERAQDLLSKIQKQR